MKRITALIVCLSIAYGNMALGQNKYIDSLRMCLSTAKSDSDLLEVLDIIAGNNSNTDTVELYSNIEINLAQRTGNTEMECKGMGHLCWAYNAKGDFGKSCTTAYKGMLIAQKTGDKVAEAIFKFHLSRSYEVSDPGLSKRYLKQALNTFEKENENKWASVSLVYLALNEYEMRHFDEGDRYADRAIEIDTTNHLTNELQSAYVAKGQACLLRYKAEKAENGQGDRRLLNEAKTWIRKSAALKPDNAEAFHKDRSLIVMAEVMMTEHNDFDRRQGQIDTCTYALKRVMTNRRHDGIQKLNMAIYKLRNMIYIGNGQYAQGEAYLDSLSKALTDSMMMSNKMSKAIELMYSDLYSASGNWEKAYRHLQEYNNKDNFDRDMLDMMSAQDNARDYYEEESTKMVENGDTEKGDVNIILVILLSIVAGILLTIVLIKLRSRKG